MSWKALVILSLGFEEIEAVTVIDVLRRASVPVTTASLTDELTVQGSHGITLTADSLFESQDISLYNVIVLPGGLSGVERMLTHATLISWVCQIHESGGILAAVCAAPLVLDAAGVLKDTLFTCHPTVRHRLSAKARVTDDFSVSSNNIVTGRSAGCALIWAIALAERLCPQLPESFYNGLNFR